MDGVINMKTILIIALFFYPLFAACFENEPDGFRGIKWGVSAKTIKALQLSTDKGRIKVYTRENDKEYFANVPVYRTEYFFFDDKFSYVEINMFLDVAVSRLLKSLIAHYGPYPHSINYDYSQKSNKAIVHHSCDLVLGSNRACRLTIGSTHFVEQSQQYIKQNDSKKLSSDL